ncbi:MAG: hypothetical protein ACJ8AO_22240 [Gemmatimonadaceae bacterium]
MLATQSVPPGLPRQPVARSAPIGTALLVVLALVAIIATGLWIARRALRASGISGERRGRRGAEREEAFMAMTLAMHEARRRGGAAPASGSADPRPEAAPYEGPVHCPACGASLGAPSALLRYVTKCPGCARRVSARAEGRRVSVDVEA